tara:strand:+ start:1288 stop:2529 length:1242 start_codon:yes stop_codon:yes gene_type:complete
MKLFQKLLLTPVALGFFSPIAANASEANLMDVSSYSQVDVEVSQDTFKPLSSKNPLLAGGEGLGSSNSGASDFDGDTFSSTTSATFSSNFLFGNTNGVANEKANFIFDYGIALTTSFTGNDSLDVEIESGIAGSLLPEADLADTSKNLNIDTISYTSTLGDRLTFLVGGGATPGSALYASACAYDGITDTMDDCGVATTNLDEGLGSTFAASFDAGSGITFAVGVESENNADGLLTDQSVDAYGAQLAYSADNYGVAIAFASIENHSDSVTTGSGSSAVTTKNVLSTGTSAGVTTSTSVSAYFTPDIENLPSISVGFESSHNDAAAVTSANDETSHYFVGVQWDEFGQGTLGASFGSKAATVENADAEVMYEIFYAYNYADGITITPAIYVKENAAVNTDDETGLLLKTSFSF